MDYIRARLGSMHETDALPLLASVAYMCQLGKVSQSHIWKLLGSCEVLPNFEKDAVLQFC